MAEENADGIKSSLTKWLKAGLTSVVGLVSGAVLMYLTPIINNTIKPAKPIANFATQITGLTVTFNNRSTGGTAGWWDFGDGSALEPYSPSQTIFTHVYDKPGTYNVRLSLQNLLQEQSDRTVAVTADASTSTKPEIRFFDVSAVGNNERAPAIYRLQSKVKNAAYSIVGPGDDRPLQLDSVSTHLERYFSFEEMGAYTIRLAVVNGKEIVEKSKTVYVSPSEGLEPMAKLAVSYQAVRVESVERTFKIPCDWQGDAKDSTCPINAARMAHWGGYKFTKLTIVNKDEENAPVRNLKCEIAPDKTRFNLTGELVKSTTLLESKPLPRWMAMVKASMQRRSAPVLLNRGEVSMSVQLNSTVKIPMQPLEDGWEAVSTQATLELWDGTRKVWESNKPVTNAKVTLKNQLCYVTMMPQIDGMLLKIDAPSASPVTFRAPPKGTSPPPVTIQAPPKVIAPPPVTFQAPPKDSPPTRVPVVARPASFERLSPLLTRPKKN